MMAVMHRQQVMNGENQAPVQAAVAVPTESKEEMGPTFIESPYSADYYYYDLLFLISFCVWLVM